MILYTCEGSRGLRVGWTAAELGISLDYRMMPFPPRKFCPEYVGLNPLGTVPMLVDGEIELTESSAICHYIVEKQGNSSLLIQPGEPDYGYFLDFLHHADTTLTFAQTVYLRFAVLERSRGLAEAGEAYGRWFGARLARIEERLNCRDYLCADRFTIADLAVCYSLWLAQRTGLSRHFSPRLTSYMQRQIGRPAFLLALCREREAGSAVTPSFLDLVGG